MPHSECFFLGDNKVKQISHNVQNISCDFQLSIKIYREKDCSVLNNCRKNNCSLFLIIRFVLIVITLQISLRKISWDLISSCISHFIKRNFYIHMYVYPSRHNSGQSIILELFIVGMYVCRSRYTYIFAHFRIRNFSATLFELDKITIRQASIQYVCNKYTI